MLPRAAILILVSACLCAAQPPAEELPAAQLAAAEKACEGALRAYAIEAGIDVMMPVRGVAADNYGAVFVSQVNLAALPLLFGFGGQVDKAELARVRAAKLKKAAAIGDVLVRMMSAAAQAMPALKDSDSIVVKLCFFNGQFEDRTGLPVAVTARATKGDLLAAANGQLPPDELARRMTLRREPR